MSDKFVRTDRSAGHVLINLPRPKPKKPARRLLILIAGCAVLVSLGGVISLLLIDKNWLAKTLAEKAAEHLGADLEIGEIELDIFRGKATLRDIAFERLRPTSTIRGKVARADLSLDVTQLIFRRFEFERLLVESPEIYYEKHAPGAANVEGGWRDDPGDPPTPAGRFGQAPPKSRDVPYFRFGQLIVHDGAMTYKSRMNTAEPFEMEISSLEYLGNGVSLHWLFGEFGLLHGAYLEADIVMGSKAKLRKLGTSNPEKFSLKGVDLAYLDRMLDRDDAIDIAGGQLHVRYFVEDAKIRYEVGLADFALSENENAASSTMFHIPASKIVDFVNERSGDFEFTFTLDKRALDLDVSADLEDAIRAWFGAFWEELVKQVVSQGIRAQDIEGVKDGLARAFREIRGNVSPPPVEADP